MQTMRNRREMLPCTAGAGALTDLDFIGCGLSTSALAQAPPRRREVVLDGKRALWQTSHKAPTWFAEHKQGSFATTALHAVCA